MAANPSILVVIRNVGALQRQPYLDTLVSEGFRVELLPPGRDPVPALRALQPVAACFQYDYPDIAGLSDLQRTKAEVPSVPLLMVTQDHSESLAVWAFRTRVWDYFVEPVEQQQLQAVLRELIHLRAGNAQCHHEREPFSPPHALPAESRVSAGSAARDRAIDFAVSHIDRNLHTKISQSEVARCCNLTSFQLSRMFKQVCGITFQEYVLKQRIDRAMQLLGHPGASVTDVCFAVGFRDLSYFTRTFHRLVGEPPSRYRSRQLCGSTKRMEAEIPQLRTQQRTHVQYELPGLQLEARLPSPDLRSR